MYSEKIEAIIESIVDNGELDETAVRILSSAAKKEGEDPDEVLLITRGRLAKANAKTAVAVPVATPKHSTKVGDEVKHCPRCGAVYVPGSASCPECGYAFSGLTASRSILELTNKLDETQTKYEQDLKDYHERKQERFRMKASRRNNRGVFLNVLSGMQDILDHATEDEPSRYEYCEKKVSIVSSFPVPNQREDLLDLITSIEPKINNKGPKDGQSFWNSDEDLSYGYWLLFGNCINKAKISFSADPAFTPFIEKYDKMKNGK